ncbi:ABC transporter permease [Streptomyces sp. 21So2-11]|uniref:ABC transporter permease n=1 Tax=Streptomyces sp. 21So2-11 TaxID=3144408 RepID=UPI003219B5A4
MSVGCSLGVACLAAVLTIPAILAAHNGRSAERDPQTVLEVMHARSAADTVFLERQDPYGSRPFNRVFVSRPTTGPAPVPPGLDRLPAPGEVLVSPQLRKIVADEPGLLGLLPGRITGTIGAEGLAGPDELYAYVGQTRDQIPSARPLAGFGSRFSPSPVVEPDTLDILRFTLACLVLLPLVVFLSVCARLSAETRARRLASLRLLGLSIRGTLRVNAVETVVAALLGALLGIGEYFLVNEVMARIGLPGLQWYAADGRPSVTTLAICLLACPALAWLVGRHHGREAALTPLNVRRSAQRKPPRKYGLLLLLPGLGVITGYCVLGALGHDPSQGYANAVLVPAAVLLTGAGLVLALAPITSWLARRLAGTTQFLPLTLAMRRNEVEPGSSLRVVTGLVLLVYAASLTQGVLVELNQVSRPNSPTQEYRLALADVTAGQRARMARIDGVRAKAVTAESWIPAVTSTAPRINAFVGTCAQLASFSDGVSGCVDGKVQRLTEPGYPQNPDAKPGKSYPFLLRQPSGRPSAHGTKFSVTVPHDHLTIHARQPSALSGSDVLVPPSLLPARAIPANGDFYLTTSSEPQAVRTALNGIGALAPTAAVEPVGLIIETLQQITVVKSLLAVGMILGLVIGVAAFIVSVADRAMERRGQITTLALLGARATTLRTAQCIQVLLPLAIGLVAALVAGRLAESSYLITGGGAVFWDGDGLPLLLACTLGVLVVAGAASIPLVRRHVDPEHIRRD